MAQQDTSLQLESLSTKRTTLHFSRKNVILFQNIFLFKICFKKMPCTVKMLLLQNIKLGQYFSIFHTISRPPGAECCTFMRVKASMTWVFLAGSSASALLWSSLSSSSACGRESNPLERCKNSKMIIAVYSSLILSVPVSHVSNTFLSLFNNNIFNLYSNFHCKVISNQWAKMVKALFLCV